MSDHVISGAQLIVAFKKLMVARMSIQRNSEQNAMACQQIAECIQILDRAYRNPITQIDPAHISASNFNSSGSKYLRHVQGDLTSPEGDVLIDVYAVIKTFDVKCPARQHAIKKLLCAGLRSKASEAQDLSEAKDAIERAIQLQGVCKTA